MGETSVVRRDRCRDRVGGDREIEMERGEIARRDRNRDKLRRYSDKTR